MAGTALRLLVLLIVFATVAGKVCDVVHVPGQGDMCAPAIFVPGFGKCSTNALKWFTTLHPHVKWTEKSEVHFDPAEISPQELVGNHSPGVRPDDMDVWMVKSPSMTFKGGSLASRLLTTYPSASVLFMACDPSLLPFRWFRHYMMPHFPSRILTFSCKGPSGSAACGTQHRPGDTAVPQDIIDVMQRHYAVNATLMDLYTIFHAFDSDCKRTPHQKDLLRILHSVLHLDCKPHYFNEDPSSCQDLNPRRANLEDPSRSDVPMGMGLDKIVRAYMDVGYTMRHNLDVFFMEAWSTSGADYIQRVHKYLKVAVDGYPWDRADFEHKFYSFQQNEAQVAAGTQAALTALSNTSEIPPSQVLHREALHVCCEMEALQGSRPPWNTCQTANCSELPPRVPAKVCDVVQVPGQGDLCAPAIFVAGFAHCGTNALMAYTELHPNVKWARGGHVNFDPAVTSPRELVGAHCPGVFPADPNVWMIKYTPAFEGGAPLARRLLQAYPSASILFASCDPELRPFRMLRHNLLTTLTYRCDGQGPQEPCGSHVQGDRASPIDVLAVMHKYLNTSSLLELYPIVFPFETDCQRPPAQTMMLRVLMASFTAPGLFNQLYCTHQHPVHANLIDTETNLPDGMGHDKVVRAFVDGGYVLHRNLEVLFMENWKDHGADAIRQIHHLLGISVEGYPWDANNFAPVYTFDGHGELNNAGHGREEQSSHEAMSSGLDDTSALLHFPVLRQEAERVCSGFEGFLGYRPPWDACQAQGVYLQPSLPSEASPRSPPSPPPSPPSPPPPGPPSQSSTQIASKPPPSAHSPLPPLSPLPGQSQPPPPPSPSPIPVLVTPAVRASHESESDKGGALLSIANVLFVGIGFFCVIALVDCRMRIRAAGTIVHGVELHEETYPSEVHPAHRSQPAASSTHMHNGEHAPSGSRWERFRRDYRPAEAHGSHASKNRAAVSPRRAAVPVSGGGEGEAINDGHVAEHMADAAEGTRDPFHVVRAILQQKRLARALARAQTQREAMTGREGDEERQRISSYYPDTFRGGSDF